MIKKEQDSLEFDIKCIKAGIDIKKKQCTKYRKATEHLFRLKKLFDSNEITGYDFAGKCAAVSITQKK